MAISFVAGGTATSSGAVDDITLPCPSGAGAGDALLCAIVTYIPGSWSTIPAGWVNHGSVALSDGTEYLWLFTKTATASEPTNYNFVFSAVTIMLGAIVDYSGNPVIDALVGEASSSAVSEFGGANVATSNADDMIIGFWASDGASIVAPSGLTTRESTSGAGLVVADFTAGAAGSYGTGNATGPSGYWAQWTVALRLPVPLAPTLLTPPAGATEDLASGFTFSEQYNSGGATGGETGYHFRRKVTGGSYQYWDAGTSSWSSTDVENTSVNPAGTSITFASGKWSDGNTYQWSMASVDANGTGPYAPDETVIAQAPPSVTVTAPTGTIEDTSLTVTWSATPASGCTITGYRVVVYNSSQYGAGGFTPGSGPSVYDSGVQSGNPGSLTIDLASANGESLRAYVQVTQTGAQVSPWQYTAFSLAVNPPATPSFTVTPASDANGRPFLYLEVFGHDNVLSAQLANFIDGSTPWPDAANADLTVINVEGYGPPLNIEYGMQVKAIANGSVSVYDSAGGTAAHPVVGGNAYSAMAFFAATTAGRSCQLVVNWFKSSGAASSHPSDSVTITDTTSGWTTALLQVTAPSDAAFAQLEIVIVSALADEIHLVAGFDLCPGTVTSGDWSPGGYTQAGVTAEFQRSDDGGSTYADVRSGVRDVGLPAETSAMDDYEAIPNQTTYYRARIVSGSIASSWSSVVSSELVNSSWDVMNPVAGGPAIGLHRVGVISQDDPGSIDIGPVSIEFDRTEVQGEFVCFGRSTYVVTRDVLMAQEFDLGLAFYGDEDASFQAFDALRSQQVTVLLRGDRPGDRYYVALGPARPAQIIRAGDRTENPTRAVQMHCYPVPTP